MTSGQPLHVEHSALCCPLCGDQWIHIDDTYVSGRDGEDEPVRRIRVGPDAKPETEPLAHTPISDEGRRHVIALAGWCETCDRRFAWTFKQHKGQTIVEVVRYAKAPADSVDFS